MARVETAIAHGTIEAQKEPEAVPSGRGEPDGLRGDASGRRIIAANPKAPQAAKAGPAIQIIALPRETALGTGMLPRWL